MRELTLVFSGILYRFVAYAAVTSLLFSTWWTIDAARGTLLYALSTFCFIWGTLIGTALVAWAWKETRAQEDQHKQRMDYWAAETRLIAPPEAKAEPPAPLQVFTTAPTSGGSKTTVQQYEPEQIPPVDFIEWLFIRANGSGRVPSERAIFEEWTATANPWLATLEEQRIVEKVGTHDNAPRRIVEGVTVAMARERFGYSAPALPDSDSSQNARN